MHSFKRSTAIMPTLSSLLTVATVATLTTLSAQQAQTPKAGTQAAAAKSDIAGKPPARESFASDEAYQSYALGMYFGPNNRYFFRGKEVDVEALRKGVESVFDGGEDFSYAVGASVALQIAHRNADVDVDQLVAGLVDAFNYEEPKMSRDEQRQAMSDVEAGLKAARAATIEASAPENEAKGAAFLAENMNRDGVVTTDSGLQYEVIEEGEGAKPGPDDTVMVSYTGSRLDGTVFDRTDKGTPKRLSLKSRYIIPGWKEAMLMMSPGAKYKLYIPHDLGYGMEPRNNVIGGNETLIMEVALVSAEPPRKSTPRPTPGGRTSAVTPPVRVPLPKKGGARATAVTPPVKVEIPPRTPGKEAKRSIRVTPPVKVEFPPKKETEKKTEGDKKE